MAIRSALTLCVAGAAAGAGAEEGIHVPGAILRPSLDVSATHDSNVWMESQDSIAPDDRGVVSDLFYAADLRLSLATTRAETIRARADAWGRWQRYSDTGARDSDEIGLSARTQWGKLETMQTSLDARWAAVDQYDRGPAGSDLDDDGLPDVDPTLASRDTLTKRTLLDLGVDAGRDLTDKLTLRLRLAASTIRYDDAPANADALNDASDDTSTYRIAAETGWKATDKTSVFMVADGGIEDSEDYEEPARRIAIRLGAQSTATEKLRCRSAVGVMRYSYDPRAPDPAADPEESDPEESESRSDTGLSFELGFAWTPRDRWNLQAAASSGYRPPAPGSDVAVRQAAGTLRAAYRIGRGLHIGLGGDLLIEEDLDPTDIADPAADGGRREIGRQVDLVTAFARIEHRPPDSMHSVHVEWRARHAASNDPNSEYAVRQLSAGATLRF